MRMQMHPSLAVALRDDVHLQIGNRQQPSGFFRPLSQFQAGAGKDVAETGVFPFLRVSEAVEVKV